MWSILFGLMTSVFGSVYAWWWFSVGRWRSLLKRMLRRGLIIGKIIDVFLPGTGWLSLSRHSFFSSSEDNYIYTHVDQKSVNIMRGLIGETIG